jgi:hypothetical protein
VATVRSSFLTTPEVRRELAARAALRGTSATHEVNLILAEALGMAPRGNAGHVEGGAFARSALGRLADRGGWFTVEQAAEATGKAWAITGVHLRELVRAGVLAERVVPGASGGRKEWASAEPMAPAD